MGKQEKTAQPLADLIDMVEDGGKPSDAQTAAALRAALAMAIDGLTSLRRIADALDKIGGNGQSCPPLTPERRDELGLPRRSGPKYTAE
jgi:hypothetical protein